MLLERRPVIGGAAVTQPYCYCNQHQLALQADPTRPRNRGCRPHQCGRESADRIQKRARRFGPELLGWSVSIAANTSSLCLAPSASAQAPSPEPSAAGAAVNGTVLYEERVMVSDRRELWSESNNDYRYWRINLETREGREITSLPFFNSSGPNVYELADGRVFRALTLSGPRMARTSRRCSS
jgi:hypothetical protein